MTTSGRSGCWKLRLVSALAIGGALALGGGLSPIADSGDCARAQIAPDATLGADESSSIRKNVNINGLPGDRIDGGARRGANLFHSFREFNIGENQRVYFANPAGVENILSRVTGGNLSNILGTLGVTGGNANLFLINPNGIIFGQNASLDVGGSFVGTTANAIGFDDQGFFSASEPKAPSLLTVNPSAFLFNQIAAGPINSIENQGFLSVPTGHSLLLVGGKVSPDTSSTGRILLNGGRLRAPGGRVEVGGLAERGAVELNIAGSDLSLGFPEDITRVDVSLINAAEIDVTAGSGGNIAIYAQNLDILEGSDICAGIGATSTCGELASDFGFVGAQAGDITFNGLEAITIAGQVSKVENDVNPGAIGNSGNINILAGSLFLTDGGQLSASTFGEGNSGSVNISARDTVSLDNGDSDSYIFNNVGPDALGNSGGINITTGSLSVTNGAQIQSLTQGQGDAGKVTIVARDTVSFDGNNEGPSGAFSIVDSEAMGNSGGIDITARSLFITNRAQLGSWTSGTGNSGNIFIQVQDRVSLLNSIIINEVSERGGGVGNGGDIRITTGSLLLKDGSALLADTENRGDAGDITIEARDNLSLEGLGPGALDPSKRVPSQISTTVESDAVGEGGNVSITTGRLSIRDGGEVSTSTFGKGNAGNLTVRASDSVELSGEIPEESPGGLLAQVDITGEGSGGNLTIETGRLSISNGSKVQVATFGQGDAGELLIRASSVEVFNTLEPHFFTGIFAGILQDPRSVTLPRGDGGKLTIETERLSIRDGARIEASVFGEGDGGDMLIEARDLVEVVGTDESDSPSFLGADVRPPEVNTPVSLEAITGNGGKLTIQTRQLSVRDGSRVSVSTFARGNAGDILVQASELVEVVGTSSDEIRSSLSADVEAGAVGKGGDLTIETPRLSIRDGARVSVQTGGEGDAGALQIDATESVQVIGTLTDSQLHSELSAAVGQNSTGKGGDLSIQTRQLTIQDGAEVSASTASSGQGGTLSVTASESVTLSDRGSLSAQATGNGNAGSLTINTRQLSVQDGAEVTVSSPQGQAGNLTAIANSVFLDQGNLTAVTGKGQGEGGANITLQAQDLLRMHNESRISADALATANGGNINIDTDFLIALPSTGPNGSDIKANAFQGNGGRLNITAQGIFGISFRPSETPLNDITASSDFGSVGVVTLNTPDVDPSQGLVNLPTDIVDASGLIAQSCPGDGTAKASEQSEFIITGRGGLPPNPGDTLSSEAVLADWATLDTKVGNRSGAQETATKPTRENALTQIVEAQGWAIGPKGEVILITSAPSVTPHIVWLPPASCHN